ncbi:Swt1 family HEPN domain-containing protein, partial [Agromyces sp. CCNWLW208]|uniref:Swt1 family HEPN domain-containing protein n=1 Tax=Agromyces sp. CCNWLW208 TaxID=3125790 RepID=UPI00301518C0
MDDPNHHSSVGEALGVLIDGLKPFVERVMREAAPDVSDWTSIMQRKDKMSGRHNLTYSNRDLSLMLRAMTERIGELGFPFDRALSRQGTNYASELRDVRNRWAHNEEFSAPSAYRAMDSMELLLRLIAADDEADRIAELKAPLLPVRPAETGPESDAASIAFAPGPAPAPATPEKFTASPAGAPSIAISAIPVLSYPMALSRIAVIDEISISGVPVDLRAASVEVDVVSVTGSLGDPKVHLVDLEAGETTTLRDLELVLDPTRMLEVDVQQHGRIRATLRDAAGTTLSETSVDVDILAGNQWIANPLHLGLELLAAHVQPNSPALSSLLVEASDRVKADTGHGDLDAYQSENPVRVDAIVTAVYDAMRARDIRYAEPPASWGQRGQRVRTPGEVLEERLGTCLDTTVTMAAALEQLGINTTLWLAKGHAFLGYWRSDTSLGVVATTDPMEIANLVDLGHIALVETTMLTGGTDSHSFGEANRAPRTRFLDGDPEALLGVSDVREARGHRIYPLPSRSVAADGTTTITTYQPPAAAVIAPYYGAPAGEGASTERTAVPRRVQLWKNALLDLSLRNKLINY